MESSYTQFLEDNLWTIAGERLDDDSPSRAIAFLNSRDSFRTFGEGLLAVMQKKDPQMTLRPEKVTSVLKSRCAATGVPITEIASPNTLSNWFSYGVRPKKGNVGRRPMFALSFALGLNAAETMELFRSVYLDRAFDYREPDEFIFYYCISKRRSWSDAMRLIGVSRKQTVQYCDDTCHTVALRGEADQIEDDAALLDYIRTHGHNFSINSVTAVAVFQRCLSNARKTALSEIDVPGKEDVFKGKWVCGDAVSNNLLYELITGAYVTGTTGTKTIFHNANLPKEIRNRFPEAATFGKREMGHEERRKGIVLLFSYTTWFRCQREGLACEYDFDDYMAQLDDLLNRCNYPTLYYGNPFDWLFLFCAQAEWPLDALAESLGKFY